MTQNDRFKYSVMNYFQCDREMAEAIIASSQRSGEIERIKRLCNYHEEQGVRNNESKSNHSI